MDLLPPEGIHQTFIDSKRVSKKERKLIMDWIFISLAVIGSKDRMIDKGKKTKGNR